MGPLIGGLATVKIDITCVRMVSSLKSNKSVGRWTIQIFTLIFSTKKYEY